ncbi:MAG: hypothetical protein PHQ44_06020 [Anaerovibrio sp.]|nr:hypothetical protein [Anaerovibrio sp.]
MLQADIFSFHRVEYIVIDTAGITIDQAGLARLASYRRGVGADRILLVDKALGQVIAAVDPKGSYQLLDVDDYRVAYTAFGSLPQAPEMHYRELHITEYFLQQLLGLRPAAQLAG